MYIIYIYIYTYYIGIQEKRWKQSSAFKRLLETLLLTIKMRCALASPQMFMGEHNSVQCH